MQRSKEFIMKYGKAIIFIIIALCLAFYVSHKVGNTKKHGVVTVAKVIRYEAAESGSSYIIDVYLKGKIIRTSVGQSCYYCIGRYFFVKVIEDDPTSFPFIFPNRPVPDCIIENVKYFKGWTSFPTCDNY